MKYACGKCERVLDERELIQPPSGGPMICLSCARHLTRKVYPPWLGLAACCVAVLALLLAVTALAAALNTKSRLGKALEQEKHLLELRRQFAISQDLLLNNNQSRKFILLPYTRTDPPIAECASTLSAADFETMTESRRSELLEIQWRLWERALKSVYPEVPKGSTLIVSVASSLGKEDRREYGRFVDGKWSATK